MFSLEMSDEESREWKRRVQELESSGDTEDRIVAILMESKIGGFGLLEKIAREKAKALLERFDLIV